MKVSSGESSNASSAREMAQPDPPPPLLALLEREFLEAQDERLAETALTRGLINAADLEQARTLKGGESGESLAAILVARGRLRASDVTALEEALAQDDTARASSDHPPLPDEVLQAA